MKKYLFFSLLTTIGLTAQTLPKGFKQQQPQQSVTFTENKGQVSDQFNKPQPNVLFGGFADGMAFHLKTNGISYQMIRIDAWKEQEEKFGKKFKVPALSTFYRLDLNWLKCNTKAEIVYDNILPGYDNYYSEVCLGGALQIKTYTGITYKNIYTDIDLHYYEKNGVLKYDYLVAAGADHQQIQIEIKGAQSIRINKAGNLIIKTPLGTISEKAPLVLQDGKILKAAWLIKNDIVSFSIKDIDHSKPFVIDPAVRAWGTYYGGNIDDRSFSCSVDKGANVYMSGNTSSSTGTVMATVGSHQFTYAGPFTCAFLVKFNSLGARQWGTYYGGSTYTTTAGGTSSHACEADDEGNVYFVGRSGVPAGNAIASPGSHQPVNNGSWDGFIAKFNGAGVRLWATYYGGSGNEEIRACSADTSGNIYVSGNTTSLNGIATPGSHQSVITGTNGVSFLAKFNSLGTRIWATYYGDAMSGCYAYSCDIDEKGHVFMFGNSSPAIGNYIVTPGCHQAVCNGTADNFLVKFDTSGVRQWGTYYGGNLFECGYACATDTSGNIFITGITAIANNNEIATPGSHQPVFGGGSYDGYLVKFDPAGVRLWGTFYGGSQTDQGLGCTTDTEGNVYLAGETQSANGNVIATLGSHQFNLTGQESAFLAKFNGAGMRQWGTYYGFNSSIGFGCDADMNGSVYLTGIVGGPTSSTAIATPGAHQTNYGGHAYDAFLVQFYSCNAPDLTLISSSNTICAGGYVILSAGGAASYTWSTGSNGLSILVSPTVTTTYTLTGDNGNNCPGVAISTIVVELCTDLKQDLQNTLQASVYPNPHNNVFNVDIEEPAELTVYDALGTLLIKRTLDKGKHIINTNTHANGIYFIQLVSKDKTVRKKLIKE